MGEGEKPRDVIKEPKMNKEEVKSCKKEYIKYSEQGQESKAAKAMYEYFNTAKYVKQIQAST